MATSCSKIRHPLVQGLCHLERWKNFASEIGQCIGKGQKFGSDCAPEKYDPWLKQVQNLSHEPSSFPATYTFDLKTGNLTRIPEPDPLETLPASSLVPVKIEDPRVFRQAYLINNAVYLKHLVKYGTKRAETQLTKAVVRAADDKFKFLDELKAGLRRAADNPSSLLLHGQYLKPVVES